MIDAVPGSVAAEPDSPRIWIPPSTLSARTERQYHVLLWQVEGTADLDVGASPMSLSAGSALWVPVGVRHCFTVASNSVTMPLFFDSAGTATTLSAPTFIGVDRDLRTLMLAYSVAWSSAITPAANLSRQLLSLIEHRRVPLAAPPLPVSPPARTVAEALRFNPGDIRSAEELALSAHASLRTIERAFLSETSMTLRQWRIRNRLEAATQLLRGDTSVQAVAQRVGYTHVNAFRRVFTAHYDMSPTEYRNRFRNQ